jgi:hypothetical protein
MPLLLLISFLLHVARMLGINFNTKPNPLQDIPQIVDIGIEQGSTPSTLFLCAPAGSLLEPVPFLTFTCYKTNIKMNTYNVEVINMRQRVTEVWLLILNKGKTQYNYFTKKWIFLLSKCEECCL